MTKIAHDQLDVKDLQLSSDITQRYKAALFPAYRAPFGIQSASYPWHTETRPWKFLTDDKVTKHLAGSYWIGPAGRAFTKTVVVDIDAHSERDKLDVWERAWGGDGSSAWRDASDRKYAAWGVASSLLLE
ncbi:MAG: hypothetical protein QGI09_08415 [Dehalococcoidia bacterium]|jgi:hypothetical protein|nr:hypothetical protein [Dehalococcoidia bacterium]